MALTHGLSIAVLIASRETPGHPAYREDCADRTFGEAMEEALSLVVDWLREGSLMHRIGHPEEDLTERELSHYEVSRLRFGGPDTLPRTT